MKMRNLRRQPKAQSLVELLIGTLMFAAVATVMLSIYSINSRELSSFYNKGDVIVDATDAINKIGVLVRTARGFGDNYGVSSPVYQPIWDYSNMSTGKPAINAPAMASNLLNGGAFLISPSFPATGDPYYSAGVLPGSVYNAQWPWQAQGFPYTLSQDTLIVQVPVVMTAGQPNGPGITQLANPSPNPNKDNYVWPSTFDGQPNTSKSGVLQAVDTYVFRVIPDPNPNRQGFYTMQEAAFPACPPGGINYVNGTTWPAVNTNTNVRLGLTTPLTLVSGIVGPLDANNRPYVFSYTNKTDGSDTTTPGNDGNPNHYLTDYNGLVVNLEVLKNQTGTKAQVAHFKTEFFLRNNAQTTLMGQPSN
jgi:hypothetical protein